MSTSISSPKLSTMTHNLISEYNVTPEQVSTVMKATITFTKPVEVLHSYECTLADFAKMLKPKKDEDEDAFQTRVAASWFTLYMNEGGGNSINLDKPSDVDIQIDYEPDSYHQEDEQDDDDSYLAGDIITSGKRAYSFYQENLPEEVARREAIRKAFDAKKADEKRTEKVDLLKKMLAELGEKV